MRWSILFVVSFFAAGFACGGDIEKENVAPSQDAGAPATLDGSTPR